MSIRSLFLFTALLAGCSEYNFESKTDPVSVPADSEVVADSDAIDTDLGDPLSSPAFVVDPPVLDFGYVEEGTFIEQDVEVTNVGDADGTLTDLMLLGSTTFSWAADRQPFTLAPGERQIIPTGLAIALPPGYEAQIRPRSGLAAKNGLTLVNSPGTIDADYRGEIGAILINHGQESFTVERGMRIAQMVVAPVTGFTWNEQEELGMTGRGAGGFGSTGVKA